MLRYFDFKNHGLESGIVMSRKMPSGCFVRLGGTAWIALAGVALLAYILVWLEFLPEEILYSWRPWVLYLGCGGLVCFFLAWICYIWEK